MRVERHGYRFTNKINTKGGITATILAVLSFILLIVGIVISFRKNGNAGIIVGALGTGAFVLSMIGLIVGMKSFQEKDKFYLYSWIGTLSSGILWIGMCIIIIKGFF